MNRLASWRLGASCRTAGYDLLGHNVLSIPKGGGSPGANGHPAVTPIAVADWWCRYLLPPGGALLDPFCGSGTMLLAGLNNGASKVIGIEKQAKYLKTCRLADETPWARRLTGQIQAP